MSSGLYNYYYCCTKLCSGIFSENGMEPCKPCPSGTYSTNLGSTSCFNCNDEENRKLCPFFVDPCEKCQHVTTILVVLATRAIPYPVMAIVILNVQRYPLTIMVFKGLPLYIHLSMHVALCNATNPSDPLVCAFVLRGVGCFKEFLKEGIDYKNKP